MSSIRLKKNIVERKIKSLIRMGIVAAVLLLLCVAIYMSGDRKAPEFDFTNAASVYYVDADDEINTDTFLEGVSASDNVDGDLTDRIVIKSMRQNADSSITVTYLVRDNSGNLTTQERIYNLSATSTDDSEAAIATDLTETENSTYETASEDETSESQSEETDETSEAVETLESDVPVETSETVAEEVVVVETEVPVESSTSEAPVIALTTTEARIATGTVLPYNDYIAYMSDDVDSVETLQNYIWIEGYYDVDWNIPGVYTLIFRVTDSDGNISEPQTLTVYVGQD